MIHFFQRLSFEHGTPRTACGKLMYAISESPNGLSANLHDLEGQHFCALHPLWYRSATSVQECQDACQRHYERDMWDLLSPEIQALIKQHYPQECFSRGIDNGEL